MMGSRQDSRIKGEIEEIREQIKLLTKRLDDLVLAASAEDEPDKPAPSEIKCEAQSEFMPDDPRLGDFNVTEFVRWIFPHAISEGRLSDEDMKFLRLWQSGTYFQSAPLPILFPFDGNVADIAKLKLGPRVGYFNDIAIQYDGVNYRLLAGYWRERALPAILNWFMKRGYSEDELRSKGQELLLKMAAKDEADSRIDYFDDLSTQCKRDWTKRSPAKPKKEPKPRKPTRKDAVLAAERMAAVHRLADGSIAAKDIKTALLRQLRLHHYTPRQFAAGIDLDTKIVMKWCKGELVIRPDELKKICHHLGVRNLFQGI